MTKQVFQTRWLLLLVLALAAVAFGATTPPAAATPVANLAPLLATDSAVAIPGQYIVVFQKGVTLQARHDVMARAVALGGEISFTYTTALSGFAGRLPQRAVETLRQTPGIAYIEADQVWSVNAVASWGLDRIDQRDLPLNDTYSNAHGNIGTGVHAYIIDTGINQSHVDYSGRIGNGFDSQDGDNNPEDCHGHGSHVAGTVGGTTYGVARGVTLHGVRVLSCFGSGSTSQVVAGVDWVADNHIDPAVGNMSLGGPASTASDGAVAGAVDAGVVMVVAAGNDDGNACNVSPAREPSAITVGATDDADQRAYFSNWGECLDIFAPGVDITSAWIGSSTASATISGTSMASPHVAGVAALVRGLHPTWTPDQVLDEINATATRNVVGDSACSFNILVYSQLTPADGPIEVTDPCPPDGGCTATHLLHDNRLFGDQVEAALALDGLYALRDHVFAGTTAGEHYRSLYYTHTGRITYLMLTNPDLRAEGAAMLHAIRPAVDALVNGGEFEVSSQLLGHFTHFLSQLASADRAAGGGELAAVIQAEFSRVTWSQLVGLSAPDAWDTINATFK